METMKYIIILSILFMGCSKEEIKETSVNVPETVLNDLEGNYGSYKSVEGNVFTIAYPNTFIYQGRTYLIETKDRYNFYIIDCEYYWITHLTGNTWLVHRTVSDFDLYTLID